MISRSSPVPIYHQLARIVKRDLLSGKFAAGDRYHSDTELKERFKLSHLTVRQALRSLVKEGLIQRRRGSGTFVTGKVLSLRDQPQAEAVLFSGWTLSSLSAWESMYFRDIYEGVDTELAKCGFRLVLDQPGVLKRFSRSDAALELGLAGAIVLQGASDVRRARTLAAHGLKTVTVNFRTGRLPAVYPDHYEGGRLAVSHLIALGHRRLAHLNTGERSEHWVEVRRAFETTLAQTGLSTANNPVIVCHGQGGSIDLGYALTRELWTQPSTPTAIFTGNDLMAIGTLRFLYEKGIRVPADVSVIGFDNIHAAEICTPPLTTVDVDRIGMGQRSVRLLLSLEPGRDRIGPQEKMPVTLVDRNSTAVPPRR